MNEKLYIETLKNNSLSDTKARRKIFNILDTHHDPITMNQLIAIAEPDLDRSTAYRIVDVFEKVGIIIRVYTGWKYRIELSEVFSSHHHHLSCSRCGSIIAFEEPPELDSSLHAIAYKQGYKLQTHSLELKGICRACR